MIVAIYAQDDGEPDRSLADSDDDDKKREDFTLQGCRMFLIESYKIQVGRIQHQLDSEQHHDGVSFYDNNRQAGTKEERAEKKQEVIRYHHTFVFKCEAITAAPISAIRSSKPATSKGRVKSLKI